MTDSSDATSARQRRRVIALLVVTAVLLLPLLGGLWYAANDALQHRSTTDWRGNRKAKQSLEHAVALIVGAPCLGALLAGMVVAMAGRRAGIPRPRAPWSAHWPCGSLASSRSTSASARPRSSSEEAGPITVRGGHQEGESGHIDEVEAGSVPASYSRRRSRLKSIFVEVVIPVSGSRGGAVPADRHGAGQECQGGRERGDGRPPGDRRVGQCVAGQAWRTARATPPGARRQSRTAAVCREATTAARRWSSTPAPAPGRPPSLTSRGRTW